MKEQILDSIGRIDDDLIEKVNAGRRSRKPHSRRWLSLAACFVLIFSIALTAEAANGTVSNLLAPVFGGARTEIVDKIGVPIGASASVNGYTLTADAIIGDRYSVMVAYTLSRDDGQPIPEHIRFRNHMIWASGYGTPIEIDPEDPSVGHFHQRYRRNEPLVGKIMTDVFTDLVIDNGEEEDTVIAEGTWELTFTLRYPDTTEELPVKSFDVTDAAGQQFRVKNILLSPLGIHLDLLFFDPDYEGGIFRDFSISLMLKDGTELKLPDGGGGGSWKSGDKKADIDYYAEFDIPIPREDIKAIVICGTSYELNNAK